VKLWITIYFPQWTLYAHSKGRETKILPRSPLGMCVSIIKPHRLQTLNSQISLPPPPSPPRLRLNMQIGRANPVSLQIQSGRDDAGNFAFGPDPARIPNSCMWASHFLLVSHRHAFIHSLSIPYTHHALVVYPIHSHSFALGQLFAARRECKYKKTRRVLHDAASENQKERHVLYCRRESNAFDERRETAPPKKTDHSREMCH
jgi:hypothetical protein